VGTWFAVEKLPKKLETLGRFVDKIYLNENQPERLTRNVELIEN